MFTGLIADIGEVTQIRRAGVDWKITVRTGFDTKTIELGESIAINGACLTVTSIADATFEVEVSPETLRRTTLEDRRVGDHVHLERALRVGDRLGGHLVLGHVDGVGVVRAATREKNATLVEVEAPPQVADYLIDKGSVGVDGVSLTVNWVRGSRFGLAIIPFTSQKTHLADLKVGQKVNLEADVLGKYVAKFVSRAPGGKLDQAMLDAFGFSAVADKE